MSIVGSVRINTTTLPIVPHWSREIGDWQAAVETPATKAYAILALKRGMAKSRNVRSFNGRSLWP
jgi:hypothetical protein